MRNRKVKRKTIVWGSVALIVVLLTAVFLHYENTALTLAAYEIENEKIPSGLQGFTIAQVSDFHNSRSHTLRNGILRELQRLEPDIIVLTGDVIDSYRTDIDLSVAFAGQLREIAPVYYVTGNHEIRTHAYDRLRDGLVAAGTVVLDNKTVLIEKNGGAFCLSGIDDPTMKHDFVTPERDIVEEELNALAFDERYFNVLLSHRPELLSCYAAYPVDLVLTGHAHGGQVRLPYIGGLYAPDQGLFPTYTSGTFTENKTTMIVSRGVGNSAFPFRIFNRPELVVVTFQAKS